MASRAFLLSKDILIVIVYKKNFVVSNFDNLLFVTS